MSDIPSSSSSVSVVAGGSRDRPEPTDWWCTNTHTNDSHADTVCYFTLVVLTDGYINN